jgi:hypothetical protein
MKQKVIEVLMVEPGREPRIVRLDNSLESLQTAVSIGADYRGLIEIISLSDEVCILCNEEGKLIGLEPNRRLWSDVLCGVFYVTGQDKEGNLCSLSAKDREHYKEYFAVPESITREEADNALFAGFYIV